MKKLMLIIALTVSSMSMAQTYESPLKFTKHAPDMEWVESKDGESKIIGGTTDQIRHYAYEFLKTLGEDIGSPDNVVMNSNDYYIKNEDGSEIRISYMVFDDRSVMIVKNN